MTPLFERSLEIIRQYQAPSGAYVACPNFPTYHYCWYRDGAYIAYAMDVAGQHDSAARFHAWAARAVCARAEVVERAVAKAKGGQALSGADILHTRYTVDGGEADAEEWPNFQLDGFGTWLWALGEHRRLAGRPELDGDLLQAADLAARYLAALWQQACFDCWEEFRDHVHPYTLAAVYGGLRAHSDYAGRDHAATLEAIRNTLDRDAVADGHFVKFIGATAVDASLLGLAVPYGVYALDDPRVEATVARIEADLRRGGGVHRYAADTYYGGGEWVLLTAWLGWYYALRGERERAAEARRWVEAQADERGWLPEQVPTGLNDPAYLDRWRARWGQSASPLLWSQAMYVVLRETTDDG
jgi:GH15 family glucan-1,4-alpha-glucosidase